MSYEQKKGSSPPQVCQIHLGLNMLNGITEIPWLCCKRADLISLHVCNAVTMHASATLKLKYTSNGQFFVFCTVIAEFRKSMDKQLSM